MIRFSHLILLMARKSYAKARFTPQEDTILTEAVNMQGCSDWGLVAGWLPGRTARQCRERWTNYVSPVLMHGAWTESEDATLLEKYAELGPRWHVIKNDLKGRSKNAIRNRYFALHRQPRAAARPKPVTPQGEATPVEQEETVDVKPKSAEPLAFLDAEHEEFPIFWQAELDPFNHNFFF
jgi:hypothetical protein